MRDKSININSPNKQCGNCRYRVGLGTNSQGQQVYGCRNKEKCKEREIHGR